MSHLLIGVVAVALVMALVLAGLFFSGGALAGAEGQGYRSYLKDIPFQLWVAIAAIACAVVLTMFSIYYFGEALAKASEKAAIQSCEGTAKSCSQSYKF